MRTAEQKGILHYFIPQYDELALFAMSLACVLLIIAAAFSDNLTINIASLGGLDIRLVIAAFVFFSGLILSIYHALTDRPKTSLEKSFLRQLMTAKR
jgi:disulfide bond formation protein DsbB